MIEMRDLLAQDEILQQGGAALAGFEGILVVVDAQPLIGRQKPISPILGIFFQLRDFIVEFFFSPGHLTFFSILNAEITGVR